MSSEQGAKHKERFQREQAPAANQPVARMFSLGTQLLTAEVSVLYLSSCY